jgi:hypothetical protein
MQQVPQPTFSQQTPPSGQTALSQNRSTQASVVHGLPSSQASPGAHPARGTQPGSPQTSLAWHSALGGLVQKPAKQTSSVQVLWSLQSAAPQHSLHTPSQQR